MKGGYKLHHIEIYNWGTFDENIWRLNPGGKNSLLTGANGSGKTTLVDAIITLLVPPSKRHYNQSSGAESKRERNEKTYVRGAYSRVQGEGGLSAKTQYLRSKDDFSILLGVFHNESAKEYLSLLQVRWFSNNDLKRAYFVAPTALNIEEHLHPLDTGGVWKKRLKKAKAEEYDSFTKYAQAFSRKFGLKSDKALTLFAQTVGIKVLGNLNEFIRTHMLEEHDSEAEFVELREHYEHLLSSHKSIEKAREQLRLLTPVVENGKAFHDGEREVRKLTELEESLAPYFAQKRQSLYEEAAKSSESDIQKKANQIQAIKSDLELLQHQRTDIQVAISTNQVYEQVQNLDKQIQQAEREGQQRHERAKRYNAIAEPLELKTDPTERVFYKNLEASRKRIEEADGELQSLQQREVDFQIRQGGEEAKLKAMQEQLASLQQRKNRIPIDQIRMREGLLKALGVTEKEMPFAAELIKVKEDDQDYATVIEQALRPLSICLLVPENLHEPVLKHVAKAKWEGRIRLLMVAEAHQDEDLMAAEDGLFSKMEIAGNHPYAVWLQRELWRNYDFQCVKGASKLAHHDQALTAKGMLKNGTAYERDTTAEGQRHILGWDNRDTVLELQRDIKSQQGTIRELQRSIDELRGQRQRLSTERDLRTRLLAFEQYGEIDWKSMAASAKQYEGEKHKLLHSSNQLQELETQLKELKAQILEAGETRDRLTSQKGTLENRLENYLQELKEVRQVLEGQNPAKLKAHKADIEGHFEGEALMISNIKKIEGKATKAIAAALHAARKSASRAERALSVAMQKFIQPSADILEQYPNWAAETLDLKAENDYLPEFRRIYDKIQQEDLPQYQKRFKDWLNERLVFDIANFKTSLENKEAQIWESVEQINESLLEIDFNAKPLTFIQLDVHKSRDVAIREFKEMLRDAMPDPAKLVQGDEEELEKSFKRIQKIIEELSDNENWRRKVTDVRNWLEFAAIERYRADKAERQYYQDSQSLSGGEKAKLAYTILASAIAYQFGIRNPNSDRRSFRFAVVDEAFSKVDPENSVYAMELFKQLNLQLMVVTPLDKINLAEPYIHSVHFVQNNNKKNSEVFDLPMEVYQLQKQAAQEIS